MKRSAIRSRILETLNESPTAPGFFSLAEIDGVIDEALEVLAEETTLLKRTAFVPLRPGAMIYTTPSILPNILAPYRVWDVHQNRRLVAVTIPQLSRFHETWPTVTGEPNYWFPVSWDQFGIWPAIAEGGGVLRVDCHVWPSALLDDDDEPEMSEGDIEALVLYGRYDGAVKRWDAMEAVTVWSLFKQRWSLAKGKSATKQSARTHQTQPSGDVAGFSSGVE